jgi:hypothetical protein
MAQVKNQLMKELDMEFYLEVAYQEWLDKNFSEPSEAEIIQMAKEYLSPYTIEEFPLYVSCANNVWYGEE